jgi:hypothetical protein
VALRLGDEAPHLIYLEPLQAGPRILSFRSRSRPSPTSAKRRMIVSRCMPVIRSAQRIELPSRNGADDLDAAGERGAVHGLPFQLDVYIFIYVGIFVNGGIYMDFREATDSLCERIDHEDVARALGVSVQTIRQARLRPDADAHRTPPSEWKSRLIRLAEERVWHYRRLIDRLRSESQESSH